MFCCIDLSLLSSSSLLNNKISVLALTWDMNQGRKAYFYWDNSADGRQDRLLSVNLTIESPISVFGGKIST